MIRFVLKSALALGVLAAVIPLGTGQRADGTSVDLLSLAVGVQQAVSDLGGFCDRAPQACSAAREVAVYTGERMKEGVRAGYAYLTEETDNPPASTDTAVHVAAEPALPDPVTTGALENFPLPRPYTPPRPIATADTEPDAGPIRSVVGHVAVPTPAPRS